MKNKKIIFLVALCLLLTGCTNLLKDSEGKVVQYTNENLCNTCKNECKLLETKLAEFESDTEENETKEVLKNQLSECNTKCETKCSLTKTETGQNLVENILCKPSDEEILYLYEQNNVDLENIEECKNIKIASGNYEGVWTSIFVKPLAWLIVKIGNIFNNYGISVIIITLLIRLALYPVTNKTAMQSELMKKAQPELEKLEKKYAGRNDQNSQMEKSQEMMVIYKKYGINPLSGCLFSFIQIPLFFAFYEALNRLPIIYEGELLGFNLGITPATAITSYSYYYYIIIVILVGLATYYSFKLNSTASMSKDQEKQMKMMSIFSVALITIMSFRVSVAIALYWIFNSAFTIIQNLLVKRGKKNDHII